jgi:uncharacterized protein with HEPN domain
MARNVAATVSEMIAAIAGLEETIAGVGLESLAADWTKRHAVQRGTEIVSEASRRLPYDVIAEYPAIPWPNIKAVGNFLRHEYHAIADEEIWNIAIHSLPELKTALIKIRQDYGEDRP